MSKFKYSPSEQKLNNVLVHQDKELASISIPSTDTMDEAISSSEDLLRRLGYELPHSSSPLPIDKKQG